MEELTISKINTKDVKTKFGPKKKYSLQVEEKPDQWFDSWVGFWNKSWAEGMRIKVDDDQWQEPSNPQYNWTIKAPESAKKFGGGISQEQFDFLVARVEVLESWRDSFTASPKQEKTMVPRDEYIEDDLKINRKYFE